MYEVNLITAKHSLSMKLFVLNSPLKAGYRMTKSRTYRRSRLRGIPCMYTTTWIHYSSPTIANRRVRAASIATTSAGK